jgi:hypothetical protein
MQTTAHKKTYSEGNKLLMHCELDRNTRVVFSFVISIICVDYMIHHHHHLLYAGYLHLYS